MLLLFFSYTNSAKLRNYFFEIYSSFLQKCAKIEVMKGITKR